MLRERIGLSACQAGSSRELPNASVGVFSNIPAFQHRNYHQPAASSSSMAAFCQETSGCFENPSGLAPPKPIQPNIQTRRSVRSWSKIYSE